MRNIVIVGSGLSGLTLCIYLLKKGLGLEDRIFLIEKSDEQLARGIAYKKEFTHQPLNVRAGKMSLYDDQPDHFVKWLGRNHKRYSDLLPQFDEMTFVARSIYGDYMQEEFEHWKNKSSNQLKLIPAEVTSMMKYENQWKLKFADQSELEATVVVLALGNFPPSDLAAVHPEIASNPNYFSFPWQAGIMNNIPKDASILFIGMGLTTIDHLITLHHNDHKGKIYAISRNGYLPLEHVVPQAVELKQQDVLSSCETPIRFLQYLRQQTKLYTEIHWSNIIDAMRPFTNLIWQRWTIEQRKYFIRRIRPFWEIHRHRIPPYSMQIVREMISSHLLFTIAGSIKSITGNNEKGFLLTYKEKKSGNLNALKADYLVNCTGPDSDFRKIDAPVIRDLITKGFIQPEELQLGLKTDAIGALIDTNDRKHDNLFTLGPTRKGQLWETVALNEIRIQARALCDVLLK